MGQSENTPLLILWKALATLAIVAVTAWYGTTFVGHGLDVATRVAAH